MSFEIRKALIPAAGASKRMMPLSSIIPKPFLPLGLCPLIEYSIKEAKISGIKNIGIIVSPSMVQVAENYSRIKKNSGINISIFIQDVPKGLVHALLMAKDWVKGEYVAVLNPDSLFVSVDPPLKILLNSIAGNDIQDKVIVPIIRMKDEWAERFAASGMVEVEGDKKIKRIKMVLPKERGKTFKQAGGVWKLCGRYVFSPKAFKELEKPFQEKGEHDDTPYLMNWAMEGRLLGIDIDAEPLDCGIPWGYMHGLNILVSGKGPDWWPKEIV